MHNSSSQKHIIKMFLSSTGHNDCNIVQSLKCLFCPLKKSIDHGERSGREIHIYNRLMPRKRKSDNVAKMRNMQTTGTFLCLGPFLFELHFRHFVYKYAVVYHYIIGKKTIPFLLLLLLFGDIQAALWMIWPQDGVLFTCSHFSFKQQHALSAMMHWTSG